MRLDEYIPREVLLNNRPEARNPNQTGMEEYNKGWNDCRSAFYQCIKNEPSADVAPVVRCKDCWNATELKGFMGGVLYCPIFCRNVESDFFCSEGVRMDGE